MYKCLFLLSLSFSLMASENFRKPAIIGNPEIEEEITDESVDSVQENQNHDESDNDLINDSNENSNSEKNNDNLEAILRDTDFKNVESLKFYNEIQQEMLAEDRVGFSFNEALKK